MAPNAGAGGMPVKFVSLLRMAPGLSRSAFRERYETRHAPFIRSVMPGIAGYRRNYFPETVAGFDVLTEIVFDSMADFERAMAAATSPAVAARIAEDETGLFDRAATVFTLVDPSE